MLAKLCRVGQGKRLVVLGSALEHKHSASFGVVIKGTCRLSQLVCIIIELIVTISLLPISLWLADLVNTAAVLLLQSEILLGMVC